MSVEALNSVTRSGKPPRESLLGVIALAFLAFIPAYMLWEGAVRLVRGTVDGAVELSGYVRSGRVEHDRRRLSRALDEERRATASTRQLRKKERVEAEARLVALAALVPLPERLDTAANRAVSFGPWVLLVALIAWTCFSILRMERLTRASRAKEAETAARREAERTAEEARWNEEVHARVEAKRAAAETTATEERPSPHHHHSCIRIIPDEDAEEFRREVWGDRPMTAREQARRDAFDRKKSEEAEAKRREAIAEKPNMPPATELLAKAPTSDDDYVAPRALSHAEWHATVDPRELIGHAVTRIPRQHLCLLLAELAEQLWPNFHERCPDDWRPAWCVATLRAWCFGEASLAQVDAAREAASKVVRRGPTALSFPGYVAARVCCTAALYASDEGVEFDSHEAAEDALLWAVSAKHHATTRALVMAVDVSTKSPTPLTRSFAEWHYSEDLDARFLAPLDRAALAELADFIRARVAWPARASERWVVTGETVRSGDATLLLEGWRVVGCSAFAPERRGRPALVT